MSVFDSAAGGDVGYGGDKEAGMLDAVMLVAGVAFFALAVAYVAACDRM